MGGLSLGLLTFPAAFGWITNPFLAQLLAGAVNLGFAVAGVCLAVAVLRYRLNDIDVIIRRTLIYSALTAMLALIYVGSVVLLRQLLEPLTGASEPAIVGSTLVVAALFNPLRRRIQNSIDKRFYRRKYDATKVLVAFQRNVRDETDLERLTDELLGVVDETMQPEFVGLWIRDSRMHGASKGTSPNSI